MPIWLVLHMQITLLSHIEYICVFLVFYLITTSLNSLKRLEKPPITKYSDMYSLPSINVNPREWIKVNNYKGVNNKQS